MDINDLRSLFTVLTVLLFAGIVWWVFSGRRKQAFDEAARQPLLDDDQPILSGSTAVGHPDK
jgi:cytochrome c oxidase cbb3-type subunit 4